MGDSLNLYRLQQLDTQIDHANKRLVEIEQALSDDEHVRAAQKVANEAEEVAKKLRMDLNQIEDRVEAQRIKRKTSQASMFSGKITNPKELQDLQMETEALKRYIAQLEDEQLALMIEYEQAENNLMASKKALQQAVGTATEENAALLGEKTRLEGDIEKWLLEKKAVLQGIPPTTLELYQNLRKSKRGVAVTTVSDGGCSICGQALTPADRQSVRMSNELVFCPSCGRVLFAD